MPVPGSAHGQRAHSWTRIRKVKCDEAYPVCQRCASTGRTCDGYGVWGGGGKQPTGPGRQPRSRMALRSVGLLPPFDDPGERGLFDWFTRRSVTKLPGSFTSEFWSGLLPQTSLSEPAVWHAILALSSTHRAGVLVADGLADGIGQPLEPETLTLQNYVKAIRHLGPHFSKTEATSVRVALITCIVFISLDLLRGHFTAAQIHLQSGLKLLSERGLDSDKSVGRGHAQPADRCIAEILRRFRLQVELFGHPQCCTNLPLRTPSLDPSAGLFYNFKEAWCELDGLLNDTFSLGSHSSRHICAESYVIQQRIQADLKTWLQIYQASSQTLKASETASRRKAYSLIGAHHAMATIMANTCLRQEDETVFDTQYEQFLGLTKRIVDLCNMRSDTLTPGPPREHRSYRAQSIVDVGCIVPLYYVALKCRVHGIRLQAIRVLESLLHREGIWDAKIAARVARRVMELEEGDFYDGMNVAEGLSPESYPQPQEATLPPLPRASRLVDVQLAFLGDPVDKVSLLGKRHLDGVVGKVCVGEYHLRSERWTGVE